jgi:hypothetical protein
MSAQVADRGRRVGQAADWRRPPIAAAATRVFGLSVLCAILAVPAQAASTERGATSAQAATPAHAAAPAHAATSATIAPSLSPNRLGARAALTFTIHYAGGESGVPSPVRRSIVHFPAGLSLNIPHLRSCTAAHLRAHGASGCPVQSEIGRGYALMKVHAGSQTIAESAYMWVFLGPPRNLQPTIEILGQGYTPFDERVVFAGTTLPDRAPYGEELVMSIPPIHSLPHEPDASIVIFSLTVGASRRHRSHDASTVTVPSSCPAGGLPFAAEFTYADGSSGNALARTPCPPPRAAIPHAHTARMISLIESGNLHLTSKHGFTLNERGPAWGTITGTIYVHLIIVSTSRVTAEVSIYTRGSSISGYATAAYRKGSSTANFSGSMSVSRGTGSYGRARGSGLSFSGTIQRSNEAVTVRVSGRLSD